MQLEGWLTDTQTGNTSIKEAAISYYDNSKKEEEEEEISTGLLLPASSTGAPSDSAWWNM